jgi:hypothetical protein
MQAIDRESVRGIVLEKYPNAVVYDDGEKISIRLQVDEEVTCSECGSKRTKQKPLMHCQEVGWGGTSDFAWQSAALNIRNSG